MTKVASNLSGRTGSATTTFPTHFSNLEGASERAREPRVTLLLLKTCMYQALLILTTRPDPTRLANFRFKQPTQRAHEREIVMEKVIRRTICPKVTRDFLSAIHAAGAAAEEEEKESMALTDTRTRLGRKPRRDADFFPVSRINDKLELQYPAVFPPPQKTRCPHPTAMKPILPTFASTKKKKKQKKRGNPINNPPIHPSISSAKPQRNDPPSASVPPYQSTRTRTRTGTRSAPNLEHCPAIKGSRMQKEGSKQGGLWKTGRRKQQVERKRVWRFTDRAGGCRRPASALIGHSTDARKRQILCL